MSVMYKILRGIAGKCYHFADKIADKRDYRYDRESDYTFAKGPTLVNNILTDGDVDIKRIYVRNIPKKETYFDEALEKAKAKGIPIIIDEHPVLKGGSGYGYSMSAEIEKPKGSVIPGNHLVMVDPAIVTNVGAVIRSALAFDIKDIVIIQNEKNLDFESPEIIRSSMGARLKVRLEVFSSIEEYMERFPENHRYAFMLRNAKCLSEIKAEAPYSLIFGNETTGLPDNYADFCNGVFIEQSKDVDSINLSNAASIGLYEFKKAIK